MYVMNNEFQMLAKTFKGLEQVLAKANNLTLERVFSEPKDFQLV